jgi:hypothetical protein
MLNPGMRAGEVENEEVRAAEPAENFSRRRE